MGVPKSQALRSVYVGQGLAAAAARQCSAKEAAVEGVWADCIKSDGCSKSKLNFFSCHLGFYAFSQFMQTHSPSLKHVSPPPRRVALHKEAAAATRAILSFWRISQLKLLPQIMVSSASSYYIYIISDNSQTYCSNKLTRFALRLQCRIFIS